MKIALFDPYLDTMSGGEKYMLSIALTLSQKHDVSILWDKTSPDTVAQQAKKRFNFGLSNLTFARSPFNTSISLSERFTMTKDYDLIILLSDGSIPIVGCRLILHFQSPMPWVNGRSLKNKLKLVRVKKIIVNSEFTKSFIDKSLGKSSVVLYPPVTLQRKYDPSKKEKIILNVGRFGINQAGSSYKKQDVLADTFVKISPQLEGWKLVLVMGVQDQDKEAFESFKKKFKDSSVEMTANVSNDTLWDLYEKASIYWHASGFGEDLASHPDRAEHFGISTVEAMGTGAVPVVVDAGGQKEIVEKGKNGFRWTSLEELQQQTLELISDKEKLQELAERGVEDAEKFSLDRFVKRVNELV